MTSFCTKPEVHVGYILYRNTTRRGSGHGYEQCEKFSEVWMCGNGSGEKEKRWESEKKRGKERGKGRAPRVDYVVILYMTDFNILTSKLVNAYHNVIQKQHLPLLLLLQHHVIKTIHYICQSTVRCY